jgi:hypothetical protein
MEVQDLAVEEALVVTLEMGARLLHQDLEMAKPEPVAAEDREA